MATFEDFEGKEISAITVADIRGTEFDKRHSFAPAFSSLQTLEQWMKDQWGFGLSFVTHVNDQKIEYEKDGREDSEVN